MESTNNSSQMHTPAAPSGQMSEAFYQLVQTVLPLLGSEAGRADFLHHLELLSRWVSTMPRSLQVNRPWTREEFAAALAGPENLLDPRFGAYMDAFYEEYIENPEDKMQSFYDELFHDEQELGRVDWLSVWESVRSSYEDWLESEYEEDEWLKGEQGPET